MRSAIEWTLAMALCVGHNFIGVRSYLLLDHYSGYADHFNTVGVPLCPVLGRAYRLAARADTPLPAGCRLRPLPSSTPR